MFDYKKAQRLLQRQGRGIKVLAAHLGKDAGYTGRYLNGQIKGIPFDIVCKIAEFLRVPCGELKVSDPLVAREDRHKYSPYASVPIIGIVGALAEPHDAPQYPQDGKMPNATARLGRVLAPTEDPQAFGLIIRGDSLLPAYASGTHLIVSPGADFISGRLYVVQDNAGKDYVRRVRMHRGHYVLEPISPLFQTVILEPGQVRHILRIVATIDEG